MITYFDHSSLNLKKWDACIKGASNTIIYAYSWYLNRVSPEWGALVLGNYEKVMPLTWNKKYGIYYLFQPLFTQQLGIFSKEEISEDTILKFIDHIPGKFRYIDINLNAGNKITSNDPSFSKRVTYELALNQPYADLYTLYNQNTRRNIKKALKNDLTIDECSPDDLILLDKANGKAKISNSQYACIEQVMQYALEHDLGELIAMKDGSGKICAAAFFSVCDNKSIYLFAASSDLGKEKRAMVYLIDDFIQRHSGKEMLLDFEGSILPALAFFYKGFGAQPQDYFHVKINRLPPILKNIKK